MEGRNCRWCNSRAWRMRQASERGRHPAGERVTSNCANLAGRSKGFERVRVEGAMIMADYPVKLKKMGWILSAAAGLSLAVCVGAAARARQEQDQGQQERQGEPQQGQQDQGPEPN